MEKADDETTQNRCKRCRGTGRISVISVELPIESGVFCPDCDIGRERWRAVSKLIDEIETDRLTTVFVSKRKAEPVA